MDHFWIGLNGVVTALADPVVGFTDPPPSYDRLPLHEVTGRALGLVQGTLLGAYRAASGLVDIATTPLWVMPEMSPHARFDLFIGPNGAGVSGGVGTNFAPTVDPE